MCMHHAGCSWVHLVVGMRNNNVDAQRVVLMCDAIDISQCSCRRLGAHHPHARGVLMCALVGGLSFTMWIRGAHVCTWWMACVHQSPCACTWRMACARTMHAPHGGCLCVHLWVDSVSQCGSGVLMCALGGWHVCTNHHVHALGGWHVCTNQHVHVHERCMHHMGGAHVCTCGCVEFHNVDPGCSCVHLVDGMCAPINMSMCMHHACTTWAHLLVAGAQFFFSLFFSPKNTHTCSQKL